MTRHVQHIRVLDHQYDWEGRQYGRVSYQRPRVTRYPQRSHSTVYKRRRKAQREEWISEVLYLLVVIVGVIVLLVLRP